MPNGPGTCRAHGNAHLFLHFGILNQSEVEYLQKWLVAHREVHQSPMAANLLLRVNSMLADNVLDREEALELFDTLQQFSGADIELGESLKATTLPLDEPLPSVLFDSRNYCFTGTFAFGPRHECEAAVVELGGACGSLTKNTNYLVIGIYATDSWAHSSYGRKIERALELKQDGVPIHIIGEQHWRAHLPGAFS